MPVVFSILLRAVILQVVKNGVKVLVVVNSKCVFKSTCMYGHKMMVALYLESKFQALTVEAHVHCKRKSF